MRLRLLRLAAFCMLLSLCLLRIASAQYDADAEVTRTRNMQYHQLEAGNADFWRTRNLQYHQLEAVGADVIRLRNLQYHQLEAVGADVIRLRNLQYHQLEAVGADVIRLRNLQYFELADFTADVTRTRNLQFFQLCAQLRVTPPVQKAAHCVPFSIKVDVNEGSDLYSFEFKLQYDPALLQATGVTLGSFLNPPTTIIEEEINHTLGFVVFSASSVSPALPASGSGTIATINFDSIPGGDSALQLLDIQLLDSSSQTLGNQAIDGFFECIPVWGDINANHQVDGVDLFSLGKAFGSTPGNSNWNRYCDLNDDESVDESDLNIFSQNYGKTWNL